MRIPVLLLAGILAVIVSPAASQPASESLERDARAAFKAGRFRDAAVRFQDSASAAADQERKARMEVQSAWAHFNERNPKATREALRRAFVADPSVDVVPEFFGPDFLKIVEEVRKAATARPAVTPPPVDVAELKRVSAEKLRDGRAAEVIYDLSSVPRDKLDSEGRELLAKAYEAAGRKESAAEVRRGGAVAGPPPIVSAPAAPPPASRVHSGVGAPEILSGGRAALQRGDAFLAQTAANKALEIDSASSEAYRLLGDSYAARGEKTLAEPMWKKSLHLDEKNTATLLSLADFYLAEKNWDAALGHLRRAVELNPADAGRLLSLARRSRGDGDVAHARMALAAASQVLPASAEVQTEYGAMLLAAGEFSEAAEALMKAAAARPRDPVVRANLAAVLRRQGKPREAEREYREALLVQPDYLPALTGLGAMLLSSSPGDAAEPFRRAVQLRPEDPENAIGLARALSGAGRLDEAAAVLKAAEETAPGKADILNEAGAVAYARGHFSEAAALFEKALARDPTMAVARTNFEKAASAAQFVRVAGIRPADGP